MLMGLTMHVYACMCIHAVQDSSGDESDGLDDDSDGNDPGALTLQLVKSIRRPVKYAPWHLPEYARSRVLVIQGPVSVMPGYG